MSHNEAGTTNSQIIDATTGVVTMVSGQAAAQSFGFLDVVMAETLGMAMYNAVNRQQGASAIGTAAVTAACAKMLGARPLVVTPSPEPPPPPAVLPLVGPPPDLPPAAAAAAAFTEAGLALAALKTQAATAAAQSQAAQADLDRLISQAGGTPPPAPAVVLASPNVVIDQAIAKAKAAIAVLVDRAGTPTGGRTELDTLIKEAGGTPPTSSAVQSAVATPDAAAAAAFVQAKSAIDDLRTLAGSLASDVSQAARTGLDHLITQAGGTPPVPPSKL